MVAFADENNGLMAQLKEKYGFSGRDWRADAVKEVNERANISFAEIYEVKELAREAM